MAEGWLSMIFNLNETSRSYLDMCLTIMWNSLLFILTFIPLTIGTGSNINWGKGWTGLVYLSVFPWFKNILTSSKRSPYDSADGLHPVFHIILGARHKEVALMIRCHPISIASCKKIVTHELCVLSWRLCISSLLGSPWQPALGSVQWIGNIYHSFSIGKRQSSYVSRWRQENTCHCPNNACLFVLATTHRPALTQNPTCSHCTAEYGETAKGKWKMKKWSTEPGFLSVWRNCCLAHIQRGH